jgi:geranylgeranyl diphosphate synthase type I
MYNKIKNKIEKKLVDYIYNVDRCYHLSKASPLLFKSIKDFITRKGKRIRPILFVIGYLGFAKAAAPNLYKTAISIELLHNFMLVHDDILDKADIRRGKLSMHKMLDKYLARFKNIKFNGQDLAIIGGDVMYALAIDAFLSIKENIQRKEKALRKFVAAAVYTATGEFIELLNGLKHIEKITKEDIYRIYDYKTAYYSFACPLSCGAILAGANQNQADILYKCGIYLGRAFQIKDDILGMFSNEKKIGKSPLTDLQEAKKTILHWYAYKKVSNTNRLTIQRLLTKAKVNNNDLFKMRKIIRNCGALDYAVKETSKLLKEAHCIIQTSHMHKKYKTFLKDYSREILSL